MTRQQLDPQENEDKGYGSYQARYFEVPDPRSDQAPSSGQKIYPSLPPSSTRYLVLTIISLAIWLFTLLFVIMIFLSTPTTIAMTSSNPAQQPVIENVLGSSTLLLIVGMAFLFFSVFLLALNLLVRRRQ